MVTHTRNLCSPFNPSKCTHIAVNTHLEQWEAIFSAEAPGEQMGVLRLAQGSRLSRGIKGGGFTLVIHSPTIPSQTWDSNQQLSGYKSDSLSIRDSNPHQDRPRSQWHSRACNSAVFSSKMQSNIYNARAIFENCVNLLNYILLS